MVGKSTGRKGWGGLHAYWETSYRLGLYDESPCNSSLGSFKEKNTIYKTSEQVFSISKLHSMVIIVAVDPGGHLQKFRNHKDPCTDPRLNLSLVWNLSSCLTFSPQQINNAQEERAIWNSCYVIKIIGRLILIHFKCRFYGGESIAKMPCSSFHCYRDFTQHSWSPILCFTGAGSLLVLRSYESKWNWIANK